MPLNSKQRRKQVIRLPFLNKDMFGRLPLSAVYQMR